MPNERLRVALLQRGHTPTTAANAIGVDPKSVERWISSGRLPYRKHRYKMAALLKVDEESIWPDALSKEDVAAAADNEIIAVYPHRWMAPRDAWGRLFESAEREIGILVYGGMFLAEDAGVMRLLARKAADGVAIRVLLGDPDSAEVSQRGADEGIDDAISAKIRNILVLYKPLRRADGVEVRLHGTVLYNSIYRADDQLLVNTHVYGNLASNAPLLHLRKVGGGDMVSMYVDSFERIWADAQPVG